MRILPVLLIAIMVTVSGCTDDKKDTAPDDSMNDTGDQNNTTAPQPVDLTVSFAGPYPASPAYSPATLSAPANATINLTFNNNDANPVINRHDWVLDNVENATTDVIGPGESDSIVFTAPPAGTYAYYCSVPGHRGQGMEGTWTST